MLSSFVKYNKSVVTVMPKWLNTIEVTSSSSLYVRVDSVFHLSDGVYQKKKEEEEEGGVTNCKRRKGSETKGITVLFNSNIS